MLKINQASFSPVQLMIREKQSRDLDWPVWILAPTSSWIKKNTIVKSWSFSNFKPWNRFNETPFFPAYVRHGVNDNIITGAKYEKTTRPCLLHSSILILLRMHTLAQMWWILHFPPPWLFYLRCVIDRTSQCSPIFLRWVWWKSLASAIFSFSALISFSVSFSLFWTRKPERINRFGVSSRHQVGLQCVCLFGMTISLVSHRALGQYYIWDRV